MQRYMEPFNSNHPYIVKCIFEWIHNQEQIARHEKNRAHEYNFVMLLDRLRSFIPVDEGNKCVTKNNAKIQPQEKKLNTNV